MGVNDAQEMLEAAQDECIRLERELARVESECTDHCVQARTERDAAHAVIEQVRTARGVIIGAQQDMLRKRPDMDALEEIAMNERHIDEALAQSPASALVKVKAAAWDEGVTRAYHSTIDELEWRLDGWLSENPYREEADRG